MQDDYCMCHPAYIGLDRGDILRDVPQIPASLVAPDFVIPEDAVGRTVRDHIRDTYFS